MTAFDRLRYHISLFQRKHKNKLIGLAGFFVLFVYPILSNNVFGQSLINLINEIIKQSTSLLTFIQIKLSLAITVIDIINLLTQLGVMTIIVTTIFKRFDSKDHSSAQSSSKVKPFVDETQVQTFDAIFKINSRFIC